MLLSQGRPGETYKTRFQSQTFTQFPRRFLFQWLGLPRSRDTAS